MPFNKCSRHRAGRFGEGQTTAPAALICMGVRAQVPIRLGGRTDLGLPTAGSTPCTVSPLAMP